MILDVIVVLLVVLITLYLATQGMLSSLLALATSIFASILAMALVEPLQGIIGGWRPEYARGATFLLLFLVAFSVTRFAADAAVPKTIKLSVLINRLTGGVAGFFTGMVVVGTLLLGLEMLPIGQTPLGFERFPGDLGMQAADSDGKPIYGLAARPANVWLAPDRLVLAIWDGAAGRSLGGGRTWASVHPDLSVESYGYRSHFDGSLRVLPKELFRVTEASISTKTKVKEAQGNEYPASGQKLVLVRTEVTKGGQAPKVSSDNDGNLRVTAPQVRLVTLAEKQYYPIGYMEWGRQFVPLTLDKGFLVDDYVKGEKTVEDWVFQVPENETPSLIEMKQLGRVELGGILAEEKFPELAKSQYPAHPWLGELSGVNVTFAPRMNTQYRSGRVYVLKPEGIRADVPTGMLRSAHEHNLDCRRMLEDGSGGWSREGKAGVPNVGMFGTAVNAGQNLLNDREEAPAAWGTIVPMLLLGQSQPDPDLNMRTLPDFFEREIVPIWRKTRKGNLIVGMGEDKSVGKVEIDKISTGRHIIVATMLTDRGFFVWVLEKELTKTGKTAITAGMQGSDSPAFQIDLEAKP